MTERKNFRDVRDRFTHIDGEIESVDVRSFSGDDGGLSARIVLRLYPWWEHPRYVEARKNADDWRFAYDDDAVRDVVIEAISPLRCNVNASRSAIDLAFLEEHPKLWEFEDSAQIVSNSDFDQQALFDSVLARGNGRFHHDDLVACLRHDIRPHAPYSLGYFPFTLFRLVTTELERMGVPFFAPRVPERRKPPVLLSIDDSVEIVAEDFVVDVPEFEHRSEWVRIETRG